MHFKIYIMVFQGYFNNVLRMFQGFHECVMDWVFQEDFNGVYRVFFAFQVVSMVLQE